MCRLAGEPLQFWLNGRGELRRLLRDRLGVVSCKLTDNPPTSFYDEDPFRFEDLPLPRPGSIPVRTAATPVTRMALWATPRLEQAPNT